MNIRVVVRNLDSTRDKISTAWHGDTIDNFKAKGIEIGMVRPKTLFPFPKQAIYDAAAKTSCRAAISVEMSMGQMVEDVELSVKGLKPVHWYGKCGGDVPTPEEVMEEITKLMAS